jgi:uncharacterized protein (TIGR00369 family)
MPTDPARVSRTYDWTPVAAGEARGGRAGLAYFEALRDGLLPEQPITATIGWRIVLVELGRIRLRFLPHEYLCHGAGIVHGGILATLLDSASASAAITTLPADGWCTTLQMNVQYLRAVRMGETEMFAEGVVGHQTRRMASTEARIEDADGQVYARATGTILIGDKPLTPKARG